MMKISVITVVKNGMPFVEQTINSVLGQTYSDLEYIIIDGGSTDGTVDVIRSHAAGIARWISEKDEGISDAFNKGLSFATGDYILFLNADDALAGSSVLTEMVEKIVENNLPPLIYGDCDVLDRSTDRILYRAAIDFSPERMGRGQTIPHPSLLAHRGYFEKYGAFDTRFTIAMDYEWLLRGGLTERIVHVPILMTNVRNGGMGADRSVAVNEIVAALKKHGHMPHAWSEWKMRGYFLARAIVRSMLKVAGIYRVDIRRRNSQGLGLREMVKRLVKKSPLYYALRNWFSRYRQRIELKAWERNGRPAPSPHLLKQHVLESYAKQYGLAVLVETGTYFGDMVEGMKRNFEKIYSIELSPELFSLAKKRFRVDGNVELICGDSGKEIGRLIPKLGRPALFWLDAHYSGGVTARAEKDTPIFEELRHILQSREKRHVVIIDDAHCFGTDPAYPTLEELTQFVRRQRSDVEILVERDSIRITPKS